MLNLKVRKTNQPTKKPYDDKYFFVKSTVTYKEQTSVKNVLASTLLQEQQPNASKIAPPNSTKHLLQHPDKNIL